MQRDELLALAQQAVDAWNRGDADGVVATLADDIEHYDAGISQQIHGKAEMRDYVQRYMSAFPDLHVDIKSNTCEGNCLVQEWVATGTHDGELMGMAPTH